MEDNSLLTGYEILKKSVTTMQGIGLAGYVVGIGLYIKIREWSEEQWERTNLGKNLTNLLSYTPYLPAAF